MEYTRIYLPRKLLGWSTHLVLSLDLGLHAASHCPPSRALSTRYLPLHIFGSKPAISKLSRCLLTLYLLLEWKHMTHDLPTMPRNFRQRKFHKALVQPPSDTLGRSGAFFPVLCLLSFLTALDGTIITTSLPTITVVIGGASDGLYIWLAQSFIFASTAPQPLYGQISKIIGRRTPFLKAIVLFALASGVAGGTTNPAMLISGRSVQSLGAEGLYVCQIS